MGCRKVRKNLDGTGCGNDFDRDEAEYQFINEYPGLNFDNLVGDICFECARDAMEAEDSGIYLETCEECGTRFDFIENRASPAYDDPSSLDADLQFVWNRVGKILCADCARDHLDEVYR